MTIKKRRDDEKAEMRKKIMNAAIELINEDGYETLSIRKIAAKIDYSPTTLYLYYKDKAQIISDMADELYKKIEGTAVSVINESAAEPADILIHTIFRSFITAICSEPEMAKAVIYNGKNVIFSNESKNPHPTNEGIIMLDRLIDRGIREKRFRSNVSGNSWMLISALLGFSICAVENQLYLLDNFESLADNFSELLIKGITP